MSRRPRKPARTVKPPRGRDALKVVEPPAPAEDPDIRRRRYVTRLVRSGFLTRPEVLDLAVYVGGDGIKRSERRKRIDAMLTESIRALRKEQRSWPRVTDCDRLDRALAELERRGILARQNYWCCGTCGCAAINDEMRKRRRAGKPVRGYTFFHEQDTESAADGYGLCLNYGSETWKSTESAAIGKEIARVLRANGLRVSWNGSIDRRIQVKLKWRRRWSPSGRGSHT